MKKALVAGILGFSIAVASVQAQSAIRLYGYNVYSSQPVGSGYTIGLYYALGDIASSVNSTIGGATTFALGNADSLLGAGVTLGTGVGSTAVLYTDLPGGYYNSAAAGFIVDPSATINHTVTVVLVAYNGASYESSSWRGHSAAFAMPAITPAGSPPGFPQLTGNYASPFAIIPEPSIFALAGVGGGILVALRRRKQGAAS